MCKSNCCCRNTSKKGLIYYLMVFIILTFVLSFISIFIRAGNTKRYKQALILLEERNNGVFFIQVLIAEKEAIYLRMKLIANMVE